jgi:hypothetical protein
MPRRPNSLASISPQGPPPMMTTWVFSGSTPEILGRSCPRGLPTPASYQRSLGDRAIPRAISIYTGVMKPARTAVVLPDYRSRATDERRGRKALEAKVGFEPTWTALQTVASPHSATSPVRGGLYPRIVTTARSASPPSGCFLPSGIPAGAAGDRSRARPLRAAGRPARRRSSGPSKRQARRAPPQRA